MFISEKNIPNITHQKDIYAYVPSSSNKVTFCIFQKQKNRRLFEIFYQFKTLRLFFEENQIYFTRKQNLLDQCIAGNGLQQLLLFIGPAETFSEVPLLFITQLQKVVEGVGRTARTSKFCKCYVRATPKAFFWSLLKI